MRTLRLRREAGCAIVIEGLKPEGRMKQKGITGSGKT